MTVSKGCCAQLSVPDAQLTQNLWDGESLHLQPLRPPCSWLREELTLGNKIRLCVILRMKLTLTPKQVTKSQVVQAACSCFLCVKSHQGGPSPVKVFTSSGLVSGWLWEQTVLLSYARKTENKKSYFALKKIIWCLHVLEEPLQFESLYHPEVLGTETPVSTGEREVRNRNPFAMNLLLSLATTLARN